MVMIRLILRAGIRALPWGTCQLIKKCPGFQIYHWTFIKIIGSPRDIFVLKHFVADIVFHYALSSATTEEKGTWVMDYFAAD
jgi:hypothetical protein